MTIRVLLVEDNDVYRSSLELLLALQPDLEVVGSVAQRLRRGRGRRARARARRRADGLPAAGPRRRRGDARRLALRRLGGRLPHRRGDRGGARGDPRRARSRSSRRAARSRRSRTRSAPRGGIGPTRHRRPAVDLTRTNDGDRARLDVRLPRRARAAREHAGRPALRPLRRRAAPRPRRHRARTQFYERLAARATLPTTSQPTPADFLAVLRGARRRRVRAHLVAPPHRRSSPGTYESAVAGRRGARRRRRPRRRHGDGLARRARCSPRRSSGGSSAGTTDEEVEQLVERFLRDERRRLHGADARVPPEGRPDREGAGARRLAPQREADPRRVEDGVIVPIARVARPAEGAEGVRAAVHGRHGGSRRAAGRDRARERAGVDRRAHRARHARAARRRRSTCRAARRRRRHARRPGRRRLLLVPGLMRHCGAAVADSRPGLAGPRRRLGPGASRHAAPVPPGSPAVDAARPLAATRSLPRPDVARAAGRHAARASARPSRGSSRGSGSRPSATCSRTARAATSRRRRSGRSRALRRRGGRPRRRRPPRVLAAARAPPHPDGARRRRDRRDPRDVVQPAVARGPA